MPRPRLALYSHDAMGLGHMRRNLLIADVLSRGIDPPEILLLSGAPEVAAFRLPAGVRSLCLPPLRKDADGTYVPRDPAMRLDTLVAHRARAILAAVQAFQPDALVADKLPRGLLDELLPALDHIRTQPGTRAVLGLRDILDDPAAVRREWSLAGNEQTIRDYYDGVWIYGDPSVYAPPREYGFAADIAARVRYTGYLDPGARTPERVGVEQDILASLPPGRLALCLVGGGQDGAPLARAFAGCTLPPGMNGVIVTGPFMPAEDRARLRAVRNERLRTVEFVRNPAWLLERADRVVSMGGYNTTCEVLSQGKPLLVVPRVSPRQEQLIRARRFERLGLLEMIHPHRASPDALEAWLAGEPARQEPLRGRIDLNGLERLPGLLMALSSEIRKPTRLASLNPSCLT